MNIIGITELRKEATCSCCSPDSAFVRATKSPVAFQEAVTCEKIKFPGLELPHSPEFTPQFTPFKCVVDTGISAHKGKKVCKKCGIKSILPKACGVMDSLPSKRVRWNKRIDTLYSTKQSDARIKVRLSARGL